MSTVTEEVADDVAFEQTNGKVGTQLPPSNRNTGAVPAVNREWIAEFEAAARRPLSQRMKYAFIKTYKPVLDDAPYRSFETIEEYRQWCEQNLPSWLGYGRV